MSKSTDQLVQIVAAGGNIVMSNKSTDQLMKIVASAARSGAHVTIKGNKSVDQIIQIATAAKGHVTFDFTD